MTSSRVSRHQTKELEVQLLREGIVESNHRVHVSVCDNRGRTLSGAGNGELGTFIRSALKPFQTLAVTAAGAIERYGLDDRDLAIMCGSHQATIEQVRQVFHILWRADLDPSDLRCPIPEGKKSPLEHRPDPCDGPVLRAGGIGVRCVQWAGVRAISLGLARAGMRRALALSRGLPA